MIIDTTVAILKLARCAQEVPVDLPANPFKRALKAGRSQIGFWCSLASNRGRSCF